MSLDAPGGNLLDFFFANRVALGHVANVRDVHDIKHALT
jgi:hypothetical protein